MTVEFEYKEKLQTAHPKHEVDVIYTCTANVYEDEIEMVSVRMSCALFGSETDWQPVTHPDEKTFSGERFMNLLREAARNEVHRISKQAVREAAQKQTT